MGTLQLVDALKSHQPAPMKKGFMYVSVFINGQAVRALLDTRATHNFISKNEAKRLGFKVTKEESTMKVVNSPVNPIAGTALGVRVTFGIWSGKLDLSIMPMDDFKMILGIEFFHQVHALPLPTMNSLSIIDGSMTCMVPAERSKIEDKMLSALQFKKGFLKDPSFLVFIQELNDGEDRKDS